MKNTNLVPELSQELQDRLQPYMPIVIIYDEDIENYYSNNYNGILPNSLWLDIINHLNKVLEPKNLVHFLSKDILESLLDYYPVRIFEMESGYTLTGKGIEVDIYRNGDYKGEGIDNIDGKLWMHIKRQLNDICGQSKVDEFAKHIITTDFIQETIKTVDQQLIEIKAFRRLADVMGFKNVSIEDYFKIIGYINKTLKP